MKLNKKGQALIEFILIFPLFIMILMAIIDFGQILYTKTSLEQEINYLVDDYSNDKTNLKSDIDGAKVNVTKKTSTTEIILSKEINILTPGLNLVFNNPYKAEVKRVIKNET